MIGFYDSAKSKSRYVNQIYLPEGATIKGYCSEKGVSKLFFRPWTKESELPLDFYRGAVVIYEGKIHILGGNTNPTMHYSWDDETNEWSEESVIPYDFDYGSACVYKGRIHIFGKGDNWQYQHYAWDGSSWMQLTNTPYAFFYNNNAQVYHDKACLVSSGFGSYSQFRFIQQWDDTSWVSALNPNNNSYSNSAVYKGLIWLLGNSGSAGTNYQTWDGTTFSSLKNLGYTFYRGYSLPYKYRIHLLGGTSGARRHYSFDGNTIRKESELPYDFSRSPAVVYKGRIHIFGGPNNQRAHYSWGKSYKVGTYFDIGKTYTINVPSDWDVAEFIHEAIERYIVKNKDYTQSPEIFSQLRSNMDTIIEYLTSFADGRRGVAIKFEPGVAYQKMWLLSIYVQYIDDTQSVRIDSKEGEGDDKYSDTYPFVAGAFTGEPAYFARLHMGGLPIDYGTYDTGINGANIGYKYTYYSNYGFYSLDAANIGMYEN